MNLNGLGIKAETVITRRSDLTGVTRSMTMPIPVEKWERWLRMVPSERPLIQDYFPELNEDQREFILTGITPEEWNDAFGDDDE